MVGGGGEGGGREEKKWDRLCYQEKGEAICTHSIYNELESDAGKSMLIKRGGGGWALF